MAAESHILDGLNLADGGFVIADTPSFVPAPLRLDMVGGIDSDGTLPVDAGRSDNAILTLPLRVKQQATADLAWGKIGAVIDKLESVRRSRDGLTHLWTPQDMTDSWELTVRACEIAEFPMNDRDSMMGYLRRFPRITIVLQCDPFLYRYGELIDYTEVTSTSAVYSILLADVPGHADAEATVTLTDNATKARRHVEGGFGTNTGSLFILATALTPLAATLSVVAGSLSSQALVATLTDVPQAIAATGQLGHVGVLHPKVRIVSTSTLMQVRLAYRTGDGDYSYTPWVAANGPLNAWSEVSLGTITIREVTNGAQEWDGRIEARQLAGGALTFAVDVFYPLDAECYWKVSAPFVDRAGVLVARDDFGGRNLGDAISVQNAQLGGAWSSSGAGADFVVSWDGPVVDDENVKRSSTLDAVYEVATLATIRTATEVGVDTYLTAPVFASQGVVARWTDVNNTACAYVQPYNPNGGRAIFTLEVRVAGVIVANHYEDLSGELWGEWCSVRLIVFSSGLAVAQLLNSSGALLATRSLSHTSLATGGTLDDGKAGIMDANPGSAAIRYYDNFYVATPPTEPVAIHPNQALEIRHDSAERESASGTTWGAVTPHGGRPFIPLAGEDGRVTRLWAKARRNNNDAEADDGLADSTKLKVSLRPRYRMPTP